jgi:hypothetical protein
MTDNKTERYARLDRTKQLPYRDLTPTHTLNVGSITYTTFQDISDLDFSKQLPNKIYSNTKQDVPTFNGSISTNVALLHALNNNLNNVGDFAADYSVEPPKLPGNATQTESELSVVLLENFIGIKGLYSKVGLPLSNGNLFEFYGRRRREKGGRGGHHRRGCVG